MEKHLYFLRHATAEVVRPGQLDIDRCLIEKGRLQARRVADFIGRHAIHPQQVLSSPYPRAVQTAAIVCKDAALPRAEEVSWLALGTDTETIITGLQALPGHTLLVGHEPDFSLLISRLLGKEHAVLNIRKASLTCLAWQPDDGGYQLQWLVPCKFM
ncbi:histidine phosphatase family protein [Chromatiaceae bacterium AAb-1]|nr:histidine phosphatase family protein [Chromatiaceae bacterium AAb-1]